MKKPMWLMILSLMCATSLPSLTHRIRLFGYFECNYNFAGTQPFGQGLKYFSCEAAVSPVEKEYQKLQDSYEYFTPPIPMHAHLRKSSFRIIFIFFCWFSKFVVLFLHSF